MPALIHKKGMEYDFDMAVESTWSWVQMVAQLDGDSMAYVVQGPHNRSGGLVGCDLAMRPGLYDHKRHHQSKHAGKTSAKLRVGDFLPRRDDGSAIRIHPQWSTTKVQCIAVEGHDYEVRTPWNGLGASDGPGTYKWYTSLGAERTLLFDPMKRGA